MFGLGVGDSSTDENKFMHYARIMMTDAAILHSHFLELDPSFVVCLDLNQMQSPTQIATVAGFIAPSTYVAELVGSALTRNARPPREVRSEDFPFRDVHGVFSRLQNKLNVYEEAFCK